MKPRRTSTSSAESAAAFRSRFDRRVGPPAETPAPAQDDQPAPAAPPAVPELAPIIDQPAASEPEPAAALAPPPDPGTTPAPPELPPGTKLCARCCIRPAIAGRPGPARCTECTNTPPGAAAETCSRCNRKLPRTPKAHYVDGQRVCRRCDPPPGWQPGRQRNRRCRDDAPRAVTISRAQLRREVAMHAAVEPGKPLDIPRPRTRGECRGQERPCPWVGCAHHVYLDVDPETGSLKLNYPHLEPWELKETCSLDVADRGGITLEEVAEVFNLTRERIRQLETRGLLKLKRGSPSPDELGADLLADARDREVLP